MILTRGIVFALALAAVQAQPKTARPCELDVPQPPMIGGLYAQDVNDPTVQSLARLSLPVIQKHKGYKELELLAIFQAFRQDVAGVIYHIVLMVDPEPGLLPTKPICRVKVFEPLSVNGIPSDTKVTEVKCGEECKE